MYENAAMVKDETRTIKIKDEEEEIEEIRRRIARLPEIAIEPLPK
jgi:hypothetical protein